MSRNWIRKSGPGWFVNAEGVKLGQHKGFPYYTIGQRKGLEYCSGQTGVCAEDNPQKNTVLLGDVEQLRTEYMIVEQDHLIDEQEVLACENLAVRIRYRSRSISLPGEKIDGRTAFCEVPDRGFGHYSGTVGCVL